MRPMPYGNQTYSKNYRCRSNSPEGCLSATVPGLQTSATDAFVLRALEICGNELAQPVTPAGAPYGSDACWMPPGAPAIVLGPGNIAQAHAVNEHIDLLPKSITPRQSTTN